MSKRSFNAANVPHYAHNKTPPIRPRAPGEYPEDIIADKANAHRAHHAVFAWIREHWKDGDIVFMDDTAPNKERYNLQCRYAIFRGLILQGNASMVDLEWLDDGHRRIPMPSTFYKSARKMNKDGGEIEIPRINWREVLQRQ